MSARTLRRRGRWTYVSHPMNGPRWRLDGTTLDLEFDDLHSGCSLRGAWILWVGDDCTWEPIDHFLDGSMKYVENAVDNDGVFAGGLGEPWVVAARAQLSSAVSPETGDSTTERT